uniref:Spermatogenesis associated 7 n=1 Tax=Periophthalmus magnuspinnatus TaxID=409849 RepID=A0A3B4ANW8_9GOBI
SIHLSIYLSLELENEYKLTQSIIKDHMISHYKKVYSAKGKTEAAQSRFPVGRKIGLLCWIPFDRGPSLSSGSSLSSTPRPSTSFHPRSTVYPTYSKEHHHPRPSSEHRHRTTLHNSLTSAIDQPFSYRTFQDPVQKTYSGDLLEKHAQRFTEDKPFTPKTLKTDQSSYLSKYRYYRSPQRTTQDSHSSSLNQKLHKREEELRCLEFITAVTDDILSRGFISDSVVDRVINRHIDMNQYHLNEGKMRHLLEVLRKDLKQPCNSPINTLNFERQEEDHLPNSFLQNINYEETKEDTDQLHYLSDIKTSDSIDYPSPICASTLLSESEKTFVVDQIDLNEDKGAISPHMTNDTPVKEHPDVGDLGTALESLNVSDHSHCDEEEPANAAVSDDEF